MPLRPLLHKLLSDSEVEKDEVLCLLKPEYLSSIDALLTWKPNLFERKLSEASQANINRGLGPRTENEATKSKLLVCHDFKGGYTENSFERGYSFEFWHLLDTFIYFSHQRVTIPPQDWIHAGHRHGVKILGTLIFEWEESKSDLCKCLYHGDLYFPKANDSASADLSNAVTSLPFSTDSALQLMKLAKLKGFDGYLLNVETDLNFLPPPNCYPGGETEWKEDAAFFEKEKQILGSDISLSSEGRERARRRRERNALALSNWTKWFTEQGKTMVGSHWEVIWYDSVTTDGSLRWQDALTPQNAVFFQNADAIFTNYTWARPSDPVPPGGIEEPKPKYHPSLLNSSRLAKELGRQPADVYVGIDVFGRNCYGGFEIYKSLDLIFPRLAAKIRSTKAISSSKDKETGEEGGEGTIDLGLSVAIFAPGWTWERERDGGGQRSWQEWWRDELDLWVGGRWLVETITERRPVATYFASRPFSHPMHSDRDASKAAPSFYTNFCQGSGSAWWVLGQKVLDASVPGEDSPGTLGWTDIGAIFPKPDRIWPHLQVLYPDKKANIHRNELHGLLKVPLELWSVCNATLTDQEVWQGAASLEIKLEVTSVRLLDNGPHCLSETILFPLVTLDQCYLPTQKSNQCVVEIVFKPLSFGGIPLNMESIKPVIIWGNDESWPQCSFYIANSLDTKANIRQLQNGWFATQIDVYFQDIQNLLNGRLAPTIAFVFPCPSATTDQSALAHVLLGEVSLRPVVSSLIQAASEEEIIPYAGQLSEKLRWKETAPPDSSSPNLLWGLLSWQCTDMDLDEASYYNVFAFISSSLDFSNPPCPQNLSKYLWLGTARRWVNSYCFVVAGLDPASLVMEQTEQNNLSFCVIPVGALENRPDGSNFRLYVNVPI